MIHVAEEISLFSNKKMEEEEFQKLSLSEMSFLNSKKLQIDNKRVAAFCRAINYNRVAAGYQELSPSDPEMQAGIHDSWKTFFKDIPTEKIITMVQIAWEVEKNYYRENNKFVEKIYPLSVAKIWSNVMTLMPKPQKKIEEKEEPKQQGLQGNSFDLFRAQLGCPVCSKKIENIHFMVSVVGFDEKLIGKIGLCEDHLGSNETVETIMEKII